MRYVNIAKEKDEKKTLEVGTSFHLDDKAHRTHHQHYSQLHSINLSLHPHSVPPSCNNQYSSKKKFKIIQKIRHVNNDGYIEIYLICLKKVFGLSVKYLVGIVLAAFFIQKKNQSLWMFVFLLGVVSLKYKRKY